MPIHLSTFQLVATGFAFAIVLIVALTEILESLRKDRPPPHGRNQSEFERSNPQQNFSTEPDE